MDRYDYSHEVVIDDNDASRTSRESIPIPSPSHQTDDLSELPPSTSDNNPGTNEISAVEDRHPSDDEDIPDCK